MKPSMFCLYAHCISNKAGFHKAAARSHLDRLLRTDWMCRAEWVAPVKCLEPENASARISVIRCFIYLIFFDDHCVICISHEGKRVASVRCHSCSSCWTHADVRENLLKKEKPARQHQFERKTLNIAARPRSWNPGGRSVARPAGLGCRRRLAKAGHVKKRQKEKCKTDKKKAKEKSKLTWVWHKSGLAFDSCAWEAEPRSSSHKIGSHSGLWQVPLKAMVIMDVKHPAFRFQRRKALSPL